MKKYKFKISGYSYEVEVGKVDENGAVISVNGTPYEVEIENDAAKSKTPVITRQGVVSKATTGEVKKVVESGNIYKVTAPLPGSISKIMVAVGDSVKIGDCVLTMEAMKMENNVSAEKSGVVKTIKVNTGDAVLQGDVLLEIA
ncbi:MAG: biotin/lipoyl-containing protein [Odoribacter sp.]